MSSRPPIGSAATDSKFGGGDKPVPAASENAADAAPDASATTVCHCGRTVVPRDPDPWEGRLDAYCYDCALNRCYPDTCPVKHPTLRGVAHTWTLPLSPGRYGYLQLPSRNVTEAEWEQLYALLEAFRPGLLLPKEDDTHVRTAK